MDERKFDQMNFSPGSRQKFVWIILAVVALIAALIWKGSSIANSGRKETLNHFNGVIDHTEKTYDTAQSDLYVRASQALKDGDDRQAEAIYREIVARYPDDPNSHEALAACFYLQKRFPLAEAQYLRAIELNARSVDALYGLGCALYEQHRHPEAKANLEKALAVNPQHAPTHRLLGFVYEALGENTLAINHYKKTLALEPDGAGSAAVQARLKALSP